MTVTDENEWSKFFSCYEDIKILYKYRRLIDRDSSLLNTHTLNMINDGELKLSSPEEFNDPFDCKIEYKSNNPDDDRILKNIVMQKENVKILCLTKNPKDILMWSHYADNHCGVCLGYKTHHSDGKLALKFKKGTFSREVEDANLGNIAWPVKKVDYANKRPEPIDFDEAKKDIKSSLPKSWEFLSHKSDMWKYEKEYRVIIYKKFLNTNPVYIKTGDLKEIIFGLNTPDDIIKNVLSIVGKGLGIDYFITRLVPRKYEVEIVPLK